MNEIKMRIPNDIINMTVEFYPNGLHFNTNHELSDKILIKSYIRRFNNRKKYTNTRRYYSCSLCFIFKRTSL